MEEKEDPCSTLFFLQREVASHKKALRRLLDALVILERERPNLAKKMRALRDQAYEDLCWND